MPLSALTFNVLAQTTYYVAADGNDNNDGRSGGSPFQTIGKVNSLNLQAGDQVLFRRGDTFRGSLTIRRSGSGGQPIVFDAYGSGAKPVLAASAVVQNWSNIGNGVWQANCSECNNRVTGLYRNGEDLPLGRYPNYSDANKGYLTIQSHQGYNQITAQQGIPLNLNTGWAGAEVVIRTTQWITDRYGFNSQSGNSLNISNPNSGYFIQDNFGFFVQNHPATLDQAGEWAFETNSKTIRLYSPQANPNDQLITVTVQERGVDLSNVSNVTLRNLHLIESLTAGLFVNNGSNLTFSNIDVTDSGEDGLAIIGSGNNVLVENSTILDSHNNGIILDPYGNVTFRGNQLRNVSMMPGRGRSADGQGNGMRISGGQNILIEDNVIDNIGYNGITYSTSTTIRRNVISNFCMTKSDGGGVYTWNGNRNNVGDIHIVSNIIYNGLGAHEGTPNNEFAEYSGANGIFFDDCTENAEIANNTVFNCTGLGIFLHETSSLSITGNTSFNNGEGQLSLINYVNKCPSRNNTIQNNILVGRLPNQFVVKFESSENDLNQFGSIDNNFYVRPFEDVFKVRYAYRPAGTQLGGDLSLSQWQSRFGHDRNSRNSPLTYQTSALTPTGNVLLANAFDNDNNGWGVSYSNQGNGQVEWDNSNRLDGGSVRVSFPQSSNQVYSYVLATNNIGPVSNGKTYRVDFDAIATGAKRVEVFIRQKFGSYSDLTAHSNILIDASRQHYTLSFNVTADEAMPIITFQVYEDGQTAWFDNVRVEEAIATTNNPDDFIKLLTNPTGQNLSISLDANYRDVKNQAYSGSVTLAPFTSLLLLKENGNTTPPTGNLRDPENPANAVAGLDYRYYEGNWSTLPDFNTLAPSRTGTTGVMDLAQRGRDEYYGLRLTGFVNVPADGTYTFYTDSDDGSKLYIGSTEVVSNDGGHPMQERSGSIGLKAGRHAITLVYFQANGGQGLSVSYSGPNLGKQTIPAAAFYRVSTGGTTPPTGNLRDPENPANAVAGLDYRYYEGNWSTLPDFNALTPSRTGTADQVDLSPRGRDEYYGLRLTGFVNVPADGTYTFYTDSDDGSKLYIGSTEVVSNDGGHPMQERSGSIGLKAGRHAITLVYFQANGGQGLSVSYSGPNLGKQTIPAAAFYRLGGGGSGGGSGLRAEYYNNTSLGGSPALSRVDATVNFEWGNDAPAAGTIGADNYSVRWSGQVEAPVTGSYTFSTLSDDGVRLWVNGVLLINNWGDHAPTTNTGSISLSGGQRYDIRMEYYENGGGAVARLSWSYAGQGDQVVPQGRLYPTGGGARRGLVSGELGGDDGLLVYPVPARDQTTLEYYSTVGGVVELSLVNGLGQVVYRSAERVVVGTNRLLLGVGSYARGEYVLRVVAGSRSISRKIILTE